MDFFFFFSGRFTLDIDLSYFFLIRFKDILCELVTFYLLIIACVFPYYNFHEIYAYTRVVCEIDRSYILFKKYFIILNLSLNGKFNRYQ